MLFKAKAPFQLFRTSNLLSLIAVRRPERSESLQGVAKL